MQFTDKYQCNDVVFTNHIMFVLMYQWNKLYILDVFSSIPLSLFKY